MEIRFDGQTALVTAGSRGIGFGVAKGLHERGAAVAICARTRSDLDQAAAELGGDRVLAIPADVGKLDDLERVVRETSDHLGPIDLLVNNSGGPPAGATLDMGEEEWRGAIDRNLLSVVRLCKLVLPGMRSRGYGRIVNLTSTTAKEPDEGMVLSSATRAGVSAYARTIAREFGPHGITVNTVLTGAAMTERLRTLVAQDVEGTDESLEDAIGRIAETVPVGYIADPDAFALTVLFLLSNAAGYVTGTSIALDGGITRSVF